MSGRASAHPDPLLPGASHCLSFGPIDPQRRLTGQPVDELPAQVHVALAGGGTAGHLVPGLAVADALRSQAPELRITFLLTGKPLETRLVREAGFQALVLPSAPWLGRWRGALRAARRMLAGYRQARRFLHAEGVSLVVGLGGYGAAPTALAALRAGIPLILLEQNVVPGRTTRLFARLARAVCLAMPQAAARLPSGCRIHLTGNPLRAAFEPAETRNKSNQARADGPHDATQMPAAAPQPRHDHAAPAGKTSEAITSRGFASFLPQPPGPGHPGQHTMPPPFLGHERGRIQRLVVLGGSGGARWINEHLPGALAELGEQLRAWQILHQTGLADEESTRQRYAANGLDAEVTAFIDNMPEVLNRAQLAVCRAGATTLSELAAAGVPAVLIPFPHAAGDHQRHNAEVFSRAGAAVVVDQQGEPREVKERLCAVLGRLLGDDVYRHKMACAMARLARPGAARAVARLVLSIAARVALTRVAARGDCGLLGRCCNP